MQRKTDDTERHDLFTSRERTVTAPEVSMPYPLILLVSFVWSLGKSLGTEEGHVMGSGEY